MNYDEIPREELELQLRLDALHMQYENWLDLQEEWGSLDRLIEEIETVKARIGGDD